MRCLYFPSFRAPAMMGLLGMLMTAQHTLAGVINVPADFAGIQQAINAATDGDEVIVAPGVYNTIINFNGKAITVRSQNVNEPGLTTINGGGAGSVVTFANGEGPDSKLAGFTIVNGGAASGGGAIVNAGCDPTIENCLFQGNSAQNGGGIAVLGQATLRNCWFIGNTGLVSGGGLYCATSGANVFLDACRFEGNDAPIGAAMRLMAGGTVVNTEVFDNVDGQAIAVFGAAPVSLVNCTVVNHAATGIALNAGAANVLTIANCIVRNNGTQITGPAARLNVRFSNVQGGFAGPGNINVNPQFINPAFDDFRLQSNSPCIDAGENASLPAGIIEDFGGVDRRSDRATIFDTGSGVAPIVDIGAHEFPPPRRYVNANATGVNHGMSWSNAYLDLQDALVDAAVPNNQITEVWVAAGTYRPDRGTGDRTRSFDMLSGLEIIGGFAGGETSADQRDPQTNQTILGGAIGAPGETDNSYHVVRAVNVDNTGKLIGFIVQKGYADGAAPDSAGGGIYISGGAPVIRECWIRQNYADMGGGLFCTFSDPNLIRNRININEAIEGAGMVFFGGEAQILNCYIAGNVAEKVGGVYIFVPSVTEITNCTILGNTATNDFGGGVASSGTLTASNNIIGFNEAASGSNESKQVLILGGTADINYSNIEFWSGALGGVGNSGANPMLADFDGADDLPGTADDNARLVAGSPCIDSADSAALPGFVDFDLDGNDRFVDHAGTANTGVGSVAYLDRGAYEFAAPCPADADGSGSVDVDDLIAVILGWGPCPAPPAACPADVNGSGAVEVDDLIAVILGWGACP